MTTDPSADLVRRTFRAGHAYELVMFDRLPPGEQVVLAELSTDPDFYGVLRPRTDSGHTIKAVSKDTALVWLTLQSPGPLPSFMLRGEVETALKSTWELVLDGVLEIEVDGQFVAGAAAMAKIMPKLSAHRPQGRLARLSYAALRYADSLGLTDPRPLAARIYGFGREPVSPVWVRRLADRKALLAFLGAGEGSELRGRLDCTWDMVSEHESQGWVVWASRARPDSQLATPTYKLYVSPKVEGMPQAFAAVVDVLSPRGGSFKVGTDAAGLLRPDKLVLYFPDQEGLLEVASRLTKELTGVSPHGVPFSAPITDDGLLSWGMDPPRSDRVLSWQEPESWRLWIVRRLAAAMISAQSDAQEGMSPSEFALERLRRQGVDVEGWTPSASIWQRV